MDCFEIRARSPAVIGLALMIVGCFCGFIGSLLLAACRRFPAAVLLLGAVFLLCLPFRALRRLAKAGVLILRADEEGLLVKAEHFPSSCIPWQNLETVFIRHVSTSSYLLVCLSDGRKLPLYLTTIAGARKGRRMIPKPLRFGKRETQHAPDYFAMISCAKHFHDQQIAEGILQFRPPCP